MREQTNMGGDNINHKLFVLVLLIANKISNKYLTEVGSKSMEGRDGEDGGGGLAA